MNYVIYINQHFLLLSEIWNMYDTVVLSSVVYFLLKRLSSCFCGSIQSTCCNHWHLYKSTCLCSIITRRTLNNCNCLLLQYLLQISTQIQIETQRNAEGNDRISMLYFDGSCVLTLEAKGMLDFQCMIARYFKTEGRA